MNMEKFQVWVDLEDRRYAKRLMEFLSVRYGNAMQVLPAGKKGVKPDGAGIYLTDRLMEAEPEQFEQYGKSLLISPDKGINPYQSGHQIAKQILDTHETQKRTERKEAEEPAAEPRSLGQWISVFSPVGGIGKSTLAMGLADILAGQKKVLFLSLEGPSAWPLYFQYPLAYTLSDYFFCYLIEGPEEKAERLQEMTFHQANGSYFLPPCLYPDDLLELSETELTEWMQLLRSQYDFVVADLSNQLLGPIRTILAGSSRLCYLLDGRQEGQIKWQSCYLKGQGAAAQHFFSRHGGKEKAGEICLPEEELLFEVQDGKRRFRKDSAYYACLERTVSNWM